MAALYGMARVIGFPVPFLLILGSPMSPVLMGICLVPAWIGFFRRHPAEIKQLVNFCLTASMQLTMAYVYPAYAFAFVRLPGSWQIPFALLLPLIKRGVKNAINSLFRDQHDLKPYMVVLNADIYHVLFVSWCMNGARTTLHTVFFVLMDLVQTAFAIRHASAISLELRTILKHPQSIKTTSRWGTVVPIDAAVSTGGSYSLLDLALAIWEHDKSDAGAHSGVQRFSAVRAEIPRRFSSIAALNDNQVTRDCRTDSVTSAVAPVNGISHSLTSRTVTSTFVLEKHPHLSCSASITTEINREAQEAVARLSVSERAECLRLVLRLLHTSELLLLIEFVEVIIPAVYCIYQTAIYHLPNKQYFESVRDLSEAEFGESVATTALYSLLELGSFVLLGAVLQRVLGLVVVKQLAFVLESQWRMAQSKLVLWVVFAVQSRLEHFGTDFSFRFAWLSNAN